MFVICRQQGNANFYFVTFESSDLSGTMEQLDLLIGYDMQRDVLRTRSSYMAMFSYVNKDVTEACSQISHQEISE